MPDETATLANTSPDVKERLRSYAERMDRLYDNRDALKRDIKDINADITEVRKEAKGVGFDVKILKAAIEERRRRRADPDDYDEAKTMWTLYFDILMAGEYLVNDEGEE